VTREWRRLLVAPERLAACAGRLTLLAEESHYLRRVLRLRGGEQLALLDGRGRLWTARLELASTASGASGGAAVGAGRGREVQLGAVAVLEQPLRDPLQCQPAASPALELAVAMPRLDGDALLRMACELGVDRFTPLLAARSVAVDRSRPQRQQTIVREAVEQCERLWQPELVHEQEVGHWFSSCLADQHAGQAAELRLLATTRREGLSNLEDLLLQPGQPLQWLRMAIGPEGGWSPEEEHQAEAAGWRPVSLGETILRTSTAAVLAAGWMAAWRRRHGQGGAVLSS
jgi:16S rRNA (uracil1498-N3)-methyltransferase